MRRLELALRAAGACARRPAMVPFWAGVAVTLVVLVRLFVPSVVALADNGEGQRLMCRFGVAASTAGEPTKPFEHAETTYLPPTPVRSCGSNPTSTAVLVQLAQALGAVAGINGIDLSLVAVLYAVALGVAAGLMWWLIPGAWPRRLLGAAGLVVVAADSTFAVFPGSAYTDTAAIFGLVLLVPVLVLLADASRSQAVRMRALAATLALGVLAVTARPTAATIAIPLVAYLLWRAVLERPPGRGSLRAWLVWPVALGAVASVIAVAGLAMTRAESSEHHAASVTNIVFAEVLPHVDDPARTLEDLGLSPELASHAGESWWSSPALRQAPELAAGLEQLSRTRIAGHLLSHPGTGLAIADQTATQWLGARPPTLGNFLPETGLAGAQECRICVFSGMLRVFQGLGLVALLFGCFGVVAVAVLLLAFRRRQPMVRSLVEVALVLLAVSMAQFVSVLLGEGIDPARHSVLSLLAAGLALVLLLSAAFAGDETPPPLDTSEALTSGIPLVTRAGAVVPARSIAEARAAWDAQMDAWLEDTEDSEDVPRPGV